MLYSMTGFGRSSQNFDEYNVTVEMRSLNSKQFDLKTKLPFTYREKEIELRRVLEQELQKGKIDFLLTVEKQDGSLDYKIDKQAFTAYYKQLAEIATELGQPLDGNLMYTVSRLPNVVVTPDALVSEQEWTNVQAVLKEALKNFKQFRKEDGKPIEDDFRIRIKLIEDYLASIEPFESERIEKYRERIMQNLDEAIRKNLEVNRFEQEVIFYMERLDVTEEKTRLKQHLSLFISELDNNDESKGRKLNFISQEIGREINTIGSKANQGDIQRIVVQMKDELEKIKEQINNVL